MHHQKETVYLCCIRRIANKGLLPKCAGLIIKSVCVVLKTALSLEAFGISDIGLVREHNEDAWKIDPEKGIFILADGMGGHNAGEVASHLSVNTTFAILQDSKGRAPLLIKRAFDEANSAVYKKGHEESTCTGMGTTLLTLVIHEDVVSFAHVGDSRLYLFRNTILEQLTEDHTLVNELISLGTLKKEDDINQFPFKHILTKAIGTHNKVEPSLSSIKLKEGDFLLLCTDGLSNFVQEKELTITLNKSINLKQKGEELIQLAKKHGGGDNVTLILIRIFAHDQSG